MKIYLELEGKTIAELMAKLENLGTDTGDAIDISELKKGKKGKPAKTVSEDEDEDFGKKPLKKKDLEEDEDSEEDESEDSEEDETEDEEESEEDEEDGLSFDEVKKALNKYGEKNPDGAKAILAGFNLKSTAALEKAKSKWEPVYRKVMAKLKAAKKNK